MHNNTFFVIVINHIHHGTWLDVLWLLLLQCNNLLLLIIKCLILFHDFIKGKVTAFSNSIKEEMCKGEEDYSLMERRTSGIFKSLILEWNRLTVIHGMTVHYLFF